MRMRGLYRFLRWLSAAALLTILLLLTWTCIDIYTDANATQQVMYQADDVQQRLQALLLPCAVLLGIVFITSIVGFITCSPQKMQNPVKAPYTHHMPAHPQKGRAQAVLMITAIVFIVLGVLNGGLYDVFVKAINICTECIGLG